MGPPKDTFSKDAHTLMVITPSGKILQLFTPIRAICRIPVSKIPEGCTVFIEAIALHADYKMVYRITGEWYVYYCFTIIK